MIDGFSIQIKGNRPTMLASPITSPLCNSSTIRTDTTRKTSPLATSPTTTAGKARHCSFLSIRTKPHPVLCSSRSSDSLFSPSQQSKADEKEPGPACLKRALEIFYPTVSLIYTQISLVSFSGFFRIRNAKIYM